MQYEDQSAGKGRLWGRALARFLTLAGLGVWLGGIVFLGAVAAPLVFRIARAEGVGSVAPQMVGAMLGRFFIISYACAALAFIGWIVELVTGAVLDKRSRLLWQVQGGCTMLMLLASLYVGQSLLPRLNAEQQQLLAHMPRTAPAAAQGDLLAGADPQLKARFDAGHNQSTQVVMGVFWLGMVALFAFSLRLSGTMRRAE